MTKELSKQLCNLCGVEPQKDCNKYNLQPCKSDCNTCCCAELIYPDFGKSSNFVKLFNLKFDPYFPNTLAGEITYKYGCIISVEDFITKLISFIKAINPNKPTDKIIQTIKNTQWEY